MEKVGGAKWQFQTANQRLAVVLSCRAAVENGGLRFLSWVFNWRSREPEPGIMALAASEGVSHSLDTLCETVQKKGGGGGRGDVVFILCNKYSSKIS